MGTTTYRIGFRWDTGKNAGKGWKIVPVTIDRQDNPEDFALGMVVADARRRYGRGSAECLVKDESGKIVRRYPEPTA